ncbi:HEL172Wp [Eremothecium sinecaudum]|uniref:HEL172Wp n=1 Tax=Eremothecium sinecaudum TaxID=45286 RepID=A0A0X8HTE3_9SACH|nr:HEL172Wp [Eremothecium sinecaudum]AMD21109.1 HEL172Wp [Eremothecium sinecaudum]
MVGDDASSRSRMARMRSNSKSNGSSAPPSPPQAAADIPTSSSGIPIVKANAGSCSITGPPMRNKYTHIIVFKSLNGTFETKFLVVPFKPDGLKLGRPVVNNNGNNNNGGGGVAAGSCMVNGQGEGQPHVRPDNGHFDSRVLSRNHASLSCDPETGAIYIRDLKSSNGTFINGTRIGQSDVELKVGDIVDLGTDIDAKFEHRKISALVEDISVIPLIHEDISIVKNFEATNGKGSANYKSSGARPEPVHLTASNAQRAAFEAAMFGDVNNLDLEEAVLGSETEILSGIFINNSIGTSPNLINVIKTLVSELTLEQTEYLKLKSMENFLINYTNNIDYLNKLRIEQNDSKLVQLQFTLRQKLNEKQEKLVEEYNAQLMELRKEKDDMKEAMEQSSAAANQQIESLNRELEDMNTRLEVEKYKNSQLSKEFEKDTLTREKYSTLKHLTKFPSLIVFDFKGFLVLGTISVGVVALAVKYLTTKSELF